MLDLPRIKDKKAFGPRSENLVTPNRETLSKKFAHTGFSTKLTNNKRQKLFRICFFEKDNFFGMGENFAKPTEWFISFEDNLNLIRISKEDLQSIHRHSCFLISQLNENYKLAIPSSVLCSEILKEKMINEFQAKKYIKLNYL